MVFNEINYNNQQLSKQDTVDLILNNIDYISNKFEQKTPQSILYWALQHFKNRVTLASSLGPQSIILTHMMTEIKTDVDLFFIDTGRLPAETYELLQECMEFFNIQYRIYFPKQRKLQNYIQENGPNAFYNSVELRKKCCEIRKVNQLETALKGYSIWISGIRRDQTQYRQNQKKIEYDERFNMIKLNPLLDWTEDMVWDYINTHELPYNPLLDQGYTSIGCEPCSRPIDSHENPRDGRWWWENNSSKECGLNITTKSGEYINLETNYIDIDND